MGFGQGTGPKQFWTCPVCKQPKQEVEARVVKAQVDTSQEILMHVLECGHAVIQRAGDLW